MKKNHIRVLALGVFLNDGRILVSEGYDEVKDEHFYRPLGGGVKFGETSEQALRREIQEELNAAIESPVLLHVFENIFVYRGKPGHEIIFLYDAGFKDKSLYQKKVLAAIEGERDEIHFEAQWKSLTELRRKAIPLYPGGLLELLEKRCCVLKKGEGYVEGIQSFCHAG